MRRLAICAAALAGALMIWAQAQAPAPDPLLQAMRDEVERSLKLTVAGTEAPYFIQSLVDDEDNFTVSASLGGVVARRHNRFRGAEVQVRVGDYKFDNTNFAGGFSLRANSGFPVENYYPVLRRFLWLQTDAAYKLAVEAFSRKRAALRNVTQNDELNDFAHADPAHYLGTIQRMAIDEDDWTSRVRALSAIFAQFPEIEDSTVDLDASAGGFYLANTEGAEVREPENVSFLRARASAQASDGMTVRAGVALYALDAARLPGDAEATRAVTEVARDVAALAHAPKGEDYTGPVLFEGEAGAQVFAEVLGRNLAPVRRPLGGPAGGGRGGATGGGRGGAAAATGELEGRIGARVLPDSFDVVDDPTQKEWRGRPLFGSYDVDREGVVPKPLHLIEKGVLKGFVLTRQPVRGFEGSNGRARLPAAGGGSGAAISNLFVVSSDTVPAGELKKNLIGLIQARSKPYGILVRKMSYPTGSAAPALVYKVFPDGREELVRGLRFRNFNVRSLKDILAAGDDSQVFEFMNSQAGFSAETCVVAPSILIDDLELYAPEDEQPKLPVVPPPELTR